MWAARGNVTLPLDCLTQPKARYRTAFEAPETSTPQPDVRSGALTAVSVFAKVPIETLSRTYPPRKRPSLPSEQGSTWMRGASWRAGRLPDPPDGLDYTKKALKRQSRLLQAGFMLAPLKKKHLSECYNPDRRSQSRPRRRDAHDAWRWSHGD